MSWLQLSEEIAEKDQLSFMQKIKFLCNNSNLTPLTSNTTNEAFQGGLWFRFVAHFPTHLSPIWLETNVAVVFSLQYNCRCPFFARIQMFAKRT